MYFEMDCPCKGKNLDKLLQPAILDSLYDAGLHGFVLIQKLSNNPMFNGAAPDRAGVYRYLKKMEDSGLLTSQWETESETNKPRRVYSITDKGKECLAHWSEALKNYLGCADALLKDIQKTVSK